MRRGIDQQNVRGISRRGGRHVAPKQKVHVETRGDVPGGGVLRQRLFDAAPRRRLRPKNLALLPGEHGVRHGGGDLRGGFVVARGFEREHRERHPPILYRIRRDGGGTQQNAIPDPDGKTDADDAHGQQQAGASRRSDQRRKRGPAPSRRADRFQRHPIDFDRADDVLDFLCAEIVEAEAQLVEHLVAHDAADANAAGLGQRLQPRSDVDAVAENIVVVDNDVADVDADAEPDPLLGRHAGIALGHAALNVDGAAHRIDDTRELEQQSIALLKRSHESLQCSDAGTLSLRA